jgi:cyclic AMP-dependent transcription factor ATF-2
MCTQMTESYPPPSYSRDYYNSFLPPYYPSSTGTYTTTTTAESFSPNQPAYDTPSPYANQFSQFSPEVSKNLTNAYAYTVPAELYTYAYLPPQPVYLDQPPFPWAETTPYPSPEYQLINPQTLSAPSSKPTSPSPLATDSPQTDTIKRQRYLHKNRVAATKCRSKKKQYIQQLQSRFEDLSLAKHELQCQVQSLRDGLISLKEELVRHARCGDGPITRYIEKRRAGCT